MYYVDAHLGRIKYVADGAIPDSVVPIEIAVVKPGFHPKGGFATAWVKGESLDHFEVKIIPDTVARRDTVAFTEGAKLMVQAKDRDEKDVGLNANTLLTVAIVTNEEYGTFIDAQGDTLKTTPVKLAGVRYGDAQGGLIRFAAVKKNPDSIEVCRIRVELQSDATKKGEKDVVVLEQTLKIVMDRPYEVRPSIPTEDANQTMVNLRAKPFEVRMTRGGKPVASHPFRLSANYVVGSGGHDHGDTRTVRRADSDDNYGYFLVGQGGQHYRPLERETDAVGKYSATYNASIFGDTMKIYLMSRMKPLLRDSLNVVEKVARLINFRNVPSNGRWTFAQTVQGRTRHPDDFNNWCSQEMSDSLQLAIDDFYEWTKTKKGGRRAIAVSLNDMSLLFGGRFDVSGKWDGRNSQAHLYHGVGTSVDVNPTLSNVQLQKLTEKMGERGLERNAERPQVHYGLTGGN